jgi:hypothetical protein
MTDLPVRQRSARRRARPLQDRDAERGFMMFLIAFLSFVGAFAVTQIASETKGLALDVIAPLTR